MQAPNISIKNLTLNIHAAPKATIPGLAMLGAAIAAGGVATTEAPANIPEAGQIWPGEGGINGGLVPARDDVPEHYLIIASKDIGDHEWGGRGSESEATSKTDGRSNTLKLIKGEHPAAKIAYGFVADGHDDFYLPAAAELYQGWVNCPEVFSQDCYYWSSSQRSASNAFHMTFVGGNQRDTVKSTELRVRPVRRLFI